MKEIILQTKKLTHKYGKQTVLEHINLQVCKGQIYGLVGKNGAGKSTLMRAVTGLINPTSGEMELFGESDEKGLSKGRMRAGVVIETPTFYPYLSARRNLEYYRIQRGIVEKQSVEEVLKQVGLGEVGEKKVKKFSLGMKQRLGLALALLGNPDMLVLDEPINGLDPAGIMEFRAILQKLNQERKVTILISSHILSELEQLATTYGFIHEGKLIEQVSAKTLEERCQHHLIVKVDNPKKASTVLEEELHCTAYEIQVEGTIKIYSYLDQPDQVVTQFAKAGIKVFSLAEVGINLEDYFMQLVGGMAHA